MFPVSFPMIAVMGPTAVGKTGLTLRLAEEIHGEIINVDSIQIYRWLDIGSAKPTREEMNRVRHHLVNIRYPFEPFDAADFAHAAGLAALNIRKRGRAVILSGGTGLYLNAFLNGLAPCSGARPGLRMTLRRFLEENGAERLHELLEGQDPQAAARLHMNDTFRVIRALEIIYSTGLTISKWHSMHQDGIMHPGAGCVRVGLIRSKEDLYSRIERRVDMMIDQGFVREVESILEKGCSPELKPLQSLGYRHIIRFLAGDAGMDETLDAIKCDTRRYAKRQLTWFRGQSAIHWFHPDQLLDSGGIWNRIAGRCAAA